ncbi:MAG: CocE/NonD family hydrolase [Nitrososphaerales archaeon]
MAVVQKGSQPIYKLKFEPDVMIPMRDGVRLASDIYRPEAEGEKFPALLAYGPWSKELSSDLQWAHPPQPASTHDWNGGIEMGNSEYIVSRGYIHVMANLRGVGYSEGQFESQYGRVGRPTDIYDVVEWIADQPWCDGQVGMIGISGFGATQMFAALQQPPHLKAIFPYDTAGDVYRDGIYDGGMLSTFSFQLGRVLAVNGDDPIMEERKKLGHEIRRKILSKEPDPLGHHIVKDMMMYSYFYNALIHPQLSRFLWDLMIDPFDNPTYRRKSYSTHYDKITIPAYCGAGWYAWTYTHLPGAFRNYNGITKSKGKKMIIGPGLHGPGDRWYQLERPFHQYHDEIMRWYDYWFKGIDTGIMDEPPIKLFVNGINKWRYETEWPLARTRWTKYYLRSFNRLLRDEPYVVETEPDGFIQHPLNYTNEIAKLTYRTAPMIEDMELTGPVTLYLHAAIDCEDKSWVDTNWISSLIDLGEDGGEMELGRGWLKASHRALDAEKSKPYQPYHDHTKESIEKIEPNRIYEYAIEFRPVSNVFKTGHRIKLEIMSMDLPGPIEFIPQHICRNDTVVHKVYHSRERPSYLLLPMIPSTDKSQWLDEERASPLPSIIV